MARWGKVERSLLRRARGVHGHTQDDCAKWLSIHDKEVSPDQASVSKWERGVNAPTGARLRAISAYIEEVLDEVEQEPDVGSSPDDDVGAEDDAVFEALTRDLTGQRLLSDEQLAHIRAVNHRLEHGPAMSTSDGAAQLRVARYLGLESD